MTYITTAAQHWGGVVSLILSTIGFVLNLLLLGVLLSQRQLRGYSNWFGVGLTTFDLLTGIFYIIECVGVIVDPDLILNFGVCQTYGALVTFFTSASLYCLFLIPSNPYRIIVQDLPPLTRPQTLQGLGAVVLISTSLAVLPYLGGGHYVIGPNHAYCYLDLVKGGTWIKVSVVINVLSYSVPSIYLLFGVYKKIYETLRNHIRARGSIQFISQSMSLTLQVQIATRGLMVFFAFMVGYSFPIAYIIYKTFTEQETPIAYDLIHVWFIITNIMFNPMIYYASDTRVQEAVDKIRGFSVEERYKRHQKRLERERVCFLKKAGLPQEIVTQSLTEVSVGLSSTSSTRVPGQLRKPSISIASVQ
ncbi:hypothetical protein EDD86DRAFT_246849 [Gorgonomyces haynaldii]|nr:hypothetical protein EDD86DRAFT_246849 [Gorgonomyces haynaldii]